MELGAHIGKYQLIEFLGGGMSNVYRAEDTVLGRTVAIKILTDSACAQPDAKARFLAEARMASKLQHDNVLGIYDFGEDDQHHPFMVMEFLRGQDLRHAIRNAQTGDVPNKLRIALQIARALQYIHAEKVIHRDIKPENVYLTPTGVAKLMDFGIAKTEGLSMTRTGFVLGTPYYMAPEQVTGKELTPQVDVYAFGVLLFELMTGAKPIAGDTVERIFYIILNEPLDLTPIDSSGAPPAIKELVARCTAKEPAARPEGFAAICSQLEELAAGGVPQPPVAPQPGGAAPAMAPSIPTPAPTPAAEFPAPRRSRRLGLWLGIAAATVLLAGAFALVWFGYHRIDAGIRAHADSVSSAGIAADGLLSPESLRHFQELRGAVVSLDPQHRQSTGAGYRLGAMLWGDLYPEARRLYFDRFRTLLLGPAQNNLVQYLRGLPATPGPPYGMVYEALKAYVVTTDQPGKSDVQFLVPILLRWWGSGLNPGDRMEGARHEMEFYAQELLRSSPYPPYHDTEAVAKARRYLGQFTGVDRVYAFLIEDAARHAPAVSFARQFPAAADTITADYEVPGPFTKAGWDFVKDAIAHGERYFAGEAWVTGDNTAATADRSRLTADLTERYRVDYGNAWRQYLRSSLLVRFASAQDGAQKLSRLAADDSPLQEWLSLAVQNMPADLTATASVFQPVEAAIAARAAYRASLTAAAAAVQKGGNGDTVFAQSLQSVKKIEATFHADPEGQAEVRVGRMLEEPILAARAVLRTGGPADWNARGAALCGQMKPVLAKYPFTEGASTQATVAEVTSLFRPQDGLLWKFYTSSLQTLVARQGPRFIAHASTGLGVNPAFLLFLNRAAAFSAAAFPAGAAQPKIHYMVRPVLTNDIDSVKLTIDGQSATFHQASPSKPFAWPGGSATEARVNVKLKNKTEFNWSKTGTPWSVFLFFDTARRRQGAQFEIPITPPATLWFEAVVTPPIFDKGYFAGLGCIPEIVKP